MSNLCKIFKGEEFNCGQPFQPGVHPDLVLFALDDLDSFVYASSPNTNVIEDIILKPGAVAYAFQGFRNSLNPQMAKVDNEFTPFAYDHILNFLVYSTSQNTKDNIENLSVSKVIGIVRNSDNTFEIYGTTLGLDLFTLTRSPGGQENGGVFAIQLKTPDGAAKEAKLPQTLFDTDFATTLDKVTDLLNLPVIINVSPLAGSAAGGDSYTITGDNFFNTADTPVADVTSLDWVDQSDQSVTNQAASFTVDSDTQISISSSVALTAGNYKVRVTTSAGVAESEAIVVIS